MQNSLKCIVFGSSTEDLYSDFEQHTLEDINECDIANPCSLPNQNCTNYSGGYNCECVDGFKMQEDGSCNVGMKNTYYIV